nr:unnamed protein product [Callosobruchus chinensis]
MARRRLCALAIQEDSSEDEDMLTPIGRPRWIRERDEHFENLDDVDFQQRFRLSKAATQEILDLIKDQLDFSTDK